ncbi:MAG TPA: lactate racemase domain-containing protein, partial [Actinomycetota bacterium]|nr:lactate racemase domain-containing protein [Actinomycetota bacterium]
MREHLVFGTGWIEAELPDDTVVVPPGVSLPLPATPDLAAEVLGALREPIDTPPLAELARGAVRVTVAFDDPTVPCYAPLWATALPLVLREIERGGVRREDIRLVCANALHRQFTNDELARLIGEDLVGEFAERSAIGCHDAEDPDAMEHVGETDLGEPVDLSTAVTGSDLTVYVNASTTRGFSGGWKSVCVGLSSYRSIRTHHSPDTMSMSTEKNRMHEALDRMGAVVDRELGPNRVFKVETLLSNPLEVHRVVGGTTAATREEVLQVTRANQPARRDLVDERTDVVLYGVPDWSPYAAYSFTNPLLTLVSTGLGYLGGMVEAVGKPGCTVILATPCPNRWDDEHHPSYREVWERVLPLTRDPYEAREQFEPELAQREDLLERYRTGFGFHPTHPIMAMYPLKRLRHAGRVIVAGAEDPDVVRHVGF